MILSRRCLAPVILASWLLQTPLPCEASWAVVKEDTEPQTRDEPVSYGVDVSFPMHYPTVTNNYATLPHNVDPVHNPTPREYEDMVVQPLGDRQSFYDDFVAGCVKHFGKKGKRCIETERDRVEMSLRQPQSMQNYTEVGYKKIKTPEKLFEMIKDFWDKNQAKGKTEQWGVGNTYT